MGPPEAALDVVGILVLVDVVRLDQVGQQATPVARQRLAGQKFLKSWREVLWGVLRDNNTAFYRIGGWDGWERQHGKLTLKAAPPAARRQGDGLKAAYFANTDLSGMPVLERIDPTIWFGPMRGDHREVADKLARTP